VSAFHLSPGQRAVERREGKRQREERVPVGRTRSRAAGTQNAFVHPIQLLPVDFALQELAVVEVVRDLGLEPGLDGLILGVEVGHVWHQVLEDIHVRQRVDLDSGGGLLVNVTEASQGVLSVDIHGT
jgi:hypothetical protein